MKKRILRLVSAMGAVVFLGLSGCAGIDQPGGKLETVGLYVWEDNPSQYEFWKSCGINTLQFCDRGWFYNAENGSLDGYLSRMKAGLESAKKAGFRVYVILFSNISQYKGPDDTEPTGLGVKFHPDDPSAREERLYYLEKMIRNMAGADGFTLFAGDPGGISTDMGEGDLEDFILMAREVGKLVERVAPEADYNINPWAVAMYRTPSVSAMTAAFWTRERAMTRELLETGDLIGGDVGVELACHEYYRPLVLRLYAEGRKDLSDKFPDGEDLSQLKKRNTERVWAWPYFLLDEADDGDTGSEYSFLQQLETRYIYRYLQNVRELGFNGVIGSWSYAAYQTKSLNTYAFGRMANDPTVTPQQAIDAFAAMLATEETCESLGQILRFVENDSNFEKKLPEEERLPPLETSVTDREDALAKLEKVIAKQEGEHPLPISPGEYLQLLKTRIEQMKS